MTDTTWTHDLATDLADLRDATRRLSDIAAGLDDAGLERRAPVVSAWSFGEQLAHMAVANRGCLLQLVQLMHGRPNPDAAPTHPLGVQALEAGTIPRGQITAPTIALPDAPMAGSEIRTLLAAQARKAMQLADKAATIAAAQGMHEHPLIKGMTAPQWVRFIVVHSRHHLAIIDDMEAALSAA
jgi:hypothetical protein